MSDIQNKAVVIGSTGFLGQALVRLLIAEGVEPLLFNRTLIPDCPHGQDSLDNLDRYSSLDNGKVVVYLVAAHIPKGGNDTFNSDLVDANIALALQVCKAFKQSQIVFCSSVSVYGVPISLPLTESSPFNGPGAYGLSKLSAESIVRAHEKFGILRFSSLYGPEITARTFLPLIVDSARNQKIIKLYGDGARQQNYLYVDDAAKMLLAVAIAEKNCIFNAVHPESYSNKNVARIVASKFPDARIQYIGEDASPSFVYDNKAWDTTFPGFEFTTLESGLSRMISHAIK